MSADRSRPIPARPNEPFTPPGKRAARLVFTLAFLVGGFLALSITSGTPRLRVGDIAQRDCRARVDFAMPDPDATEAARQAAEQKVLRIFREDTSEIARVPRDLQQFLTLVKDSRRLDEVLNSGRGLQWNIEPQTAQTISKELTAEWIDKSTPLLAAVLDNISSYGLMNHSDWAPEIREFRYEILVQGPDEKQPPVKRATALVADYPAGLRDKVAQEMNAVLSERSPEFQKAYLDLVTHAVRPTLRLDKQATDREIAAARDAVQEKMRPIPVGTILLSAGDRVTDKVLPEIMEERAAYEADSAQAGRGDNRFVLLWKQMYGALGITAVFLIGFLLVAISARHAPMDSFKSNTRLVGFYIVFLAVLVSIRVIEAFGLSLQWTPVVPAAMFFAVTMGTAPALAASGLLAALAGLGAYGGLPLALSLFLGAAVATLALMRVRRRTHVIEAGILAGVVQFGVMWAIWTVQAAKTPMLSVSPQLPVFDSMAALSGGILGGLIFTAALPYVERMFDIATDLRLLEWTDQNQPLLRKLALEAPGTYHHSTVVGNMAEAAAGEIGVNALLARAGGYLHDVGKLNRPEYFGENANGMPNPHNDISPRLSTMILTAHTKDGQELAAEYGVPAPLRNIIEEHHGTSMAEFFYDKAMKETHDASAVTSDDFRYRGPKPRCAEAAIVMLADAVESAARSLDQASPARLERLVHEIVEKRLKDGQLDESRMDITEIRAVEKSLVRSLIAVSHPRVRYPASEGR